MSDNQEKNGWNEWSKHIIRELERLNENSEKLREGIQDSNLEITKLKGLEKEIVELKSGVTSIKNEIEKSSYKFQARVDERIKTLIKEINENVVEVKNSTDSLIERISKLEDYKSYIVGIGVAVGIIITFIISVLALFDWGSIT